MKPLSFPTLRFQAGNYRNNPGLKHFNEGSSAVLLTLTYNAKKNEMEIKPEKGMIVNITGHGGRDVQVKGVPGLWWKERVVADEVDLVEFQSMEGNRRSLLYGDYQSITKKDDEDGPDVTDWYCMNKEIIRGYPFARSMEIGVPDLFEPSESLPVIPARAHFLFRPEDFANKLEPLLNKLKLHLMLAEFETPSKEEDLLREKRGKLFNHFIKEAETAQWPES